jgi:hypothetical protein
VPTPKTVPPAVPQPLKRLPDFGATCFLNTAIQLFNAIPEFKEDIKKKINSHPYVSWLRERFKIVDSPTAISKDHLRELLEKRIFPSRKLSRDSFTRKDRRPLANIIAFIKRCLCGLDLGDILILDELIAKISKSKR